MLFLVLSSFSHINGFINGKDNKKEVRISRFKRETMVQRSQLFEENCKYRPNDHCLREPKGIGVLQK